MHGLELIVPTLTLRTAACDIDRQATENYAARAAATWTDRFILSGSTGRGYEMTVSEKAEVLAIWTSHVDRARLVACCWCAADEACARAAGVQPMTVLAARNDHEQEAALRAAADQHALIYSHPRYGARLRPSLLRELRDQAELPAGGKVSKISLTELADLRRAAGPSWLLWHGSARDIQGSRTHGATGVVAAPLSMPPTPFPAPTLEAVQAAVDATRSVSSAANGLGSLDQRTAATLRGPGHR